MWLISHMAFLFKKATKTLVVFYNKGVLVVDNELRNLLYEKLSLYLKNDSSKYDVSQVIETILLIIEKYFDPDYKKFINALELFYVNRIENQDVKFSDYLNRVDISKSNNFSVKGFLSKGSPMLFFYIGDDDNPCIKLKTNFDEKQVIYSIELSNNPQVLAKYKKGENNFNNAFVVDYEFVYNSKVLERVKNVFAETKLVEDAMFLNITDFNDISNEYKNFLTLLKNSIDLNSFNTSNISSFGLEILLHSFYDEMKKLCLSDYNFSLENIVYLINKTLYENVEDLKKPESQFLDFIDDVSYETENISQNKKVKLKIPVSDKVVEYDITKSEKYLCIDAVEQGRKKCGIMIISTGDGFSVCVSNRSIKNGNVKKPSFVMNFSENQIRVMTIDANKANSENDSLEAFITFDNGFMKLNYSDGVIKKLKNSKDSIIASYEA